MARAAIAAGILVVSCAIAVAQAPPTPGIRFALSQHAVDVAKQLIVDAVVPALDNVTVPYFFIDQDTISVNMSDIRLSHVSVGNVTAILDPADGGVNFAIESLSATINADFYVRSDVWPNPSGTGTAVVGVSGAAAGLVIAVGTLGEHVNVTALRPYASAGSLDIQLNGNGITWALNLLKGVITKVVENVVASKVPEVVTKVVDVDVNAVLRRIPTSVPLPLPAPLNISTLLLGASAAGVTATYIGLDLQGAVVNTKDPQAPPFQNPDLPPYDSALGSQELQLLISPYAFESGLWVYWAAGFFEATVPSPLDTNALAAVAPDIKQYYPNNTKVQVFINTTQPVDIIMSSSPAGAFALLTVNLAFQPLNGSQPPPAAFVLTAQATADLDVFVNTTTQNGTVRQAIAAALSGVSCTLAVSQTSVGPVHAALLQAAVTLLLTDVIVPLANLVLGAGLPLPALDGLQLANTVIAFGSGYSLVATDLVKTSPPIAL